MRRWVGVTTACLLMSSLTACGSDTSSEDGKTQTALTVYAAASLTDTFTELGREFEAAHEGAKVTFNFGGSSDLVAQLQQGAPADVFASADPATMDKAVAADLVDGDPVDFASNTLEIAVPPDNPANITSLRDLGEAGTKVVVCAPQVPCGSAAVEIEEAAGVDIRPVSEEQAVTDVLTKVETGEADAGLVYVTDVKGAGAKVKGIAFPESRSAVNRYPIATLADSEDPGLAKEFVDLVTGTTGQSVLADAGFGRP